jgi:predicted dinucleotide-binding enzyme
MRSYGQYGSFARALDVVGDRWTLLILRELLLRPGSDRAVHVPRKGPRLWKNESPQGADVVILAIPQKSIMDLAPGLLSTLTDVAVVIETGNYVPQQRDGKIQEIEDGVAESRWAETHLGHPVVNAFNNILARHLPALGKPAGSPGRIALPVAGDYAAAKAVVIELIDRLGFDGVDVGGLDESWRQRQAPLCSPPISISKAPGELLPPQTLSAPPSSEPKRIFHVDSHLRNTVSTTTKAGE